MNGLATHVDLPAAMQTTISVSEFTGKVNSDSLSWAKMPTRGTFQWQQRYGGFTVSESQVERVRRYIRNQEEHHKLVSFEEKYKELLRLHGISFDEKYLWG